MAKLARDGMTHTRRAYRQAQHWFRCRVVAEGKNGDHQVRRVPVVDDAGRCAGIIAQADIAMVGPPRRTAELLSEISREYGAVIALRLISCNRRSGGTGGIGGMGSGSGGNGSVGGGSGGTGSGCGCGPGQGSGGFGTSG